MDLCEIEHYLTHKGLKIKEIIIQTDYNQKLPVGGLQIYAGFPNKDAALNFERVHNINERQVIFRHIGLYTCETCGQKGHQAEKCSDVKRSQARAANRKNKVAERKRKRQVDETG